MNRYQICATQGAVATIIFADSHEVDDAGNLQIFDADGGTLASYPAAAWYGLCVEKNYPKPAEDDEPPKPPKKGFQWHL